MGLSDLARQSQKFTIDNSPILLTGVGVAGVISTSALSYRAGRRVGIEYSDVIPLKDELRATWKEYVPPVAVGALTIVAVVASNRISTGRAAALAAAYSVTEQAFDTYKKKIVEHIGKDKEEAARAEIAQEAVNDKPTTIIVDDGQVLCYDQFTDRYFQCSYEGLKKAQNDTNYMLLNEGYQSLNQFYERVGLPSTTQGEEVGWTADKQLEVNITAVVTPNGRAALAIDFLVRPKRDYWKAWG